MLLAGCGQGPKPTADPPAIRMNTGKGEPRLSSFEVTNLPPSILADADFRQPTWRSLFTVRVADAGNPLASRNDRPAISGTWSADGSTLRFQPRLPLQPGIRYRAEFDPRMVSAFPENLGVISALFSLPEARKGAPPRVRREKSEDETAPVDR